MATKQFDSLFEQIITELTPVGAEYETFAGSLKSGIETAPGGGYLIGKLADVLGKSKEEVVDMISKDLFDKVFPEGTNPANNEDAYRASISNALLEIVKGIEASQGVKAARYIDEAEYEILTPDEMSAAGVELSDDLKTYYSRIENIADQVQKGKDLVKAIQRGGVDTGSAMKATSALIRAGAIKYATAENSDQDIQALDREEGDIEDIGRKEFERSFGKAYKDAIASEPRSMNVGFED
jgi:uncharacterized protein YacL (UPF0231 family)